MYLIDKWHYSTIPKLMQCPGGIDHDNRRKLEYIVGRCKSVSFNGIHTKHFYLCIVAAFELGVEFNHATLVLGVWPI